MWKRPFFIIGAASFFAALLCPWLPLIGRVLLVGLLGIAAAVSWLTPLSHKAVCALSLAALAVIATVSLFTVREETVVKPLLCYDGQTVCATVQVKENAGAAYSYVVQVIDGDLPSGTRLCLWLDAENAAACGDLLSGEFVLNAAFDKATQSGAYAYAHGVYLFAWSSGAPLKNEDGRTLLQFWEKGALAVRQYLHTLLFDRLPSNEAAICESMLIGEHDALTDECCAAFQSSGVYHLLVVSGFHLSLLCGTVLWLLKRLRLPRRVCAGICLPIVIAFMTLCGFSPAVTRAGLMSVLMLCAMLIRRRADGLNSLGGAATVMLLWDPFAALDVGMQLSFSAALGLLILFPIWEKECTSRVLQDRRVGAFVRPIVSLVGISLCAALFTVPLSALYFGNISAVFLLGNLLCVIPAQAILILFGLALMISLVPIFGWLADGLLWCVGWLCKWLIGVTNGLSSLPFSTVFAGERYVILWLFGLALLPLIGYKLFSRRGARRMLLLLLAILVGASGIHTLCNADAFTITVSDSKTVAFFVKEGKETGLVFEGDGKALRRACKELRRQNVRTLSWVVWLNEPSAQTIDLSSLSLPIEQLILKAPAKQYVQLPQAARITVSEEGACLSVNEGITVAFDGGFCRLCVRDTRILIARSGSDAAALPTEWTRCELLLYESLLPNHTAAIRADVVVCFCKKGDWPQRDTAPPCGASMWVIPSRDGAQTMVGKNGTVACK